MPLDNRAAIAINILTVAAVGDPLKHATYFSTVKTDCYVARNGTIHSKARVAMRPHRAHRGYIATGLCRKPF
jgi:hypothetical protein